ncbi:MAG TPA: hypothetical protein VGD78_05355 [Chthoniobacterales bacterium]
MQPHRSPEAFTSQDLFNSGLGYVVVSRFKSGGRVEAGIFLVDMYCLGVKNAMFEQVTTPAYEGRVLEEFFQGRQEPLEPWCARKLVEGAVRYAAHLGFQPHADYKKACRVFGGIDPKACPREFTFGREGKPYYVQSPYDSLQRTEQIVAILKARCGEGNFHYLLVTDDPDEFPEEFAEELPD